MCAIQKGDFHEIYAYHWTLNSVSTLPWWLLAYVAWFCRRENERTTASLFRGRGVFSWFSLGPFDQPIAKMKRPRAITFFQTLKWPQFDPIALNFQQTLIFDRFYWEALTYYLQLQHTAHLKAVPILDCFEVLFSINAWKKCIFAVFHESFTSIEFFSSFSRVFAFSQICLWNRFSATLQNTLR